MPAITIGRAAHAARRAATAATHITYIGSVVLGLGWATVTATSFRLVGRPLPTAELVTLLSALIVGSLLVGFALLLRPGFFRSLRLGEQIGEQNERRRHRCTAATTTVPTSRRAGAATG